METRFPPVLVFIDPDWCCCEYSWVEPDRLQDVADYLSQGCDQPCDTSDWQRFELVCSHPDGTADYEHGCLWESRLKPDPNLPGFWIEAG